MIREIKRDRDKLLEEVTKFDPRFIKQMQTIIS